MVSASLSKILCMSGIIIIVGLLIYLLRDYIKAVMEFQNPTTLCSLDELAIIIKQESGLFAGLTNSCFQDIRAEYYNNKDMSALQNVYSGLLTEKSIMLRFVNMANITLERPGPSQTLLSVVLSSYFNKII